MTWVRTLLCLAAILLAEAVGVVIPARHHGLVSLFVVVIPLMLAGMWLILILAVKGPPTPPRMT
jgi:hypothetical protein